jgi:hypothetical protein
LFDDMNFTAVGNCLEEDCKKTHGTQKTL